jgi:dTDP-4-amino-4,6-dideoxygalactose transaminase
VLSAATVGFDHGSCSLPPSVATSQRHNDAQAEQTATVQETDVRATYLPFALPDTDDDEIAEVGDVIRSGWITTGPKTRQFEGDFAAYVGAKHAIAVNSGTAALHLSLEAVGIAPGDEVITSPYTFAATAEVIRYLGATPVFVDIDARTLNIDPSLIERAVTARTKAIIPVHVGGLAADVDAIGAIAATHGLRVIEDAAHALPTRLRARPIGALSDFTCFSFYATKPLTTGEGGMICTDRDAWADRCRIMSLHGISRDAWKRYTADGTWFYDIIAPGYKYNLTDLAAAFGCVQLRKVERIWARRREIASRFTERFATMSQLEPPADAPSGDQHAWHLYMLRLNLDRLTITRDVFIEALRERNIGVSVHFIPLHVHSYYKGTYGYRPDSLPNAHAEYLREISLPIYSRMTDQDVEDVICAVTEVVEANRR